MEFGLPFAERFGKIYIPSKLRVKLKDYFLKAGKKSIPYKLFGHLFYLSVFLTFILTNKQIYNIIKTNNNFLSQFINIIILWITTNLGIIGVFIIILYFYYEVKIFKRTKQMESQIDDYLKLVAQNLRSGMIIQEALWNAIKPHHGELAYELQIIARKVLAGKDIEEAFNEFTKGYNSDILKRSFSMIIEGMKSGADLSQTIERTADNITEIKLLKADISAMNVSYVFFITLIVLGIAPFLFAISNIVLIIIQNISKKISQSGANTSSLGISGGGKLLEQISKIRIDNKLFDKFARLMLTSVAFFSSFIVSILRKDNAKEGLFYVPVYITISILMYKIAFAIFKRIFGSIINT